jgi:coenzyme F420-reducing hydrogenase beta subunit
MRIFAAKHLDETVRSKSTSGGVFVALCEYVLGLGGVVYGARFDQAMRVVHDRAVSMDECARFSGSKYVQSDMGSCYRLVREDMQAGRRVLFSGTPCQVAGLRSFLELSRTVGNLLTVDLVCHGVPSPMIWAAHVGFIQAAERSSLLDYRFRDKSAGWHRSRHVAVMDRGAISNHRVDAFREVFNFNYALRPSCHVCPFARLDRVADITLGDYWGVGQHFPDFDDNRGVSLVILHSEDGSAAFDAIRDHFSLIELSVEQCLQQPLQAPTPPSPQRAAFWRAYRQGGYEAAIRRFTSYGLIRRIARGLRRAIREFMS